MSRVARGLWHPAEAPEVSGTPPVAEVSGTPLVGTLPVAEVSGTPP